MKKRVALLLAAALVFSSVNTDKLITAHTVSDQTEYGVAVNGLANDEMNSIATETEQNDTAFEKGEEYDGKDVYQRDTTVLTNVDIGFPKTETPVTKQNLDLSDIELPGTDIGQKQEMGADEIAGPEYSQETIEGDIDLGNSISPESEENADINYDYDALSGTLTISGEGIIKGCVSANDIPWEAIIQSVNKLVIEEGIVGIGVNAFDGAVNLTNVLLPNTLKKIDMYAFQNCTSLQSIHLPDTVESIGYKAFAGCTELVNIDLPVNWKETPTSKSGTENVDCCGHIFEGCSKLTSVVIPNGMTVLPGYAFNNCESIKNITFPSTMNEIKNHAFYNCSGLEEVTIPDGVTSINKSAFALCSKLKVIYLSNELTELGSYAFYNCTKLETVLIPDSVKTIGFKAFADCSALNSVKLPISWETASSNTDGKVNTDTCGQIFNNCKLLKNITVPDGMERLPAYAFNGCDYIETVTLPSSLTEIKNHTFYNCTSLTGIEVPAQVTSIGKSAFCYCSKLSTVSLPSQLKDLGHFAFYNCKLLTTIHLPNSIENMGYQCFADCKSLYEINIPLNWKNCTTASTDQTFSADYCGQIFYGDVKLKEVRVPEGLKVLPKYAFNNCNYLETVNLPTDMNQIQSHAFYNCASLKSIRIPINVTILEKSTFAFCTKLTDVQLPENLLQLKEYAFYNCTSLQGMELTDSIEKIGYQAFADCTKLEDINIPNSWMESTSYSGTQNTSNSGQIFYGCKKLQKIVIPEGLTSVPDYAFNNCNYIEEVELPSTITNVGKYAFNDCTSLQTVALPDSVKKVDEYAFSYCTGLRAVTLDGDQLSVEAGAFQSCSNLAAVSVTEEVTKIDSRAFSYCSSLNRVYYTGTQEQWDATGASKNVELKDTVMTFGILCEYTEPVKILEKSYTQPEGESATDFYGGYLSASSHTIVDVDEVSFGPNRHNMFVSLPKDSYITYGFEKALMCPKNSVILITTTGNMNERADIYARTISGDLIFVGTTYETKNQHTIELGEIDEYITGIKLVGRDLDGDSPGFDVVNIGLMAENTEENANAKTNTKVSMTRDGKSYNVLTTTQNFRKDGKEEVTVLVSADWQKNTPGTVALVQNGAVVLSNKGGSFVDINPSKLFVEDKAIYVVLMDDQDKVIDLIRTKISILSDKDAEMQDLALDSVVYDYGAKHVDVLNSAHVVETTHSKFKLTCTPAVSGKVKKYQLYSGDVMVDENTTGKFENVDPSKLSASAKIFIRTVGEKEFVSTPLLLEIKSVNPLKDTSLSLGGTGLSFKLDNDVPLIGGSDFNFNFPTGIPVSCVIEDGKIKVGVNIAEKELYSSNSESGVTTTNKTKYVVDNLKKDSIKEKFEQYKKDALKAQYLKDDFKGYITSGDYKADLPACQKKVNVKICGYLQGTWSDSLETISGELIVAISASQTFQSQYLIVSVPVTVNITITGNGTMDANLGYDFINNKFIGDLAVGLNMTLEPYAGVGVGTYISAGVYGRGTVGVDITLLASKGSSKTPGLEQAYISGDMGLKAYFAKQTVGHLSLISTEDLNKTRLKEFMNGEKLVLYSTTRNSVLKRRSSVKAVTSVADIMADTQALNQRTELEVQGASTFLGTLDQDSTLLKNVYSAANPQIVKCGNETLLVYVDNEVSRALPNQSAVYYMLYSEEEGSFSEPKLLYDDNTADYQPQIVTDDDNIYVCYLNSTKEYEESEEVSLSEYAKSFGVAVAKFDKSTDTFHDMGTIYEQQYCYQPKLSISGEEVLLTWAENDAGNIFGAEGLNTIKYATYNENTWSESKELAQNKKAVTSLAVGRVNNEVLVAYAEDMDNNLSTLEQQVNMVDLNGNVKVSTKCNVTNMKFTKLPISSVDVLCGNQNGALVELNGQNFTKVFEEGFMDVSSDFFVDGNTVYAMKTNAQTSRNIACIKYLDANWYPVLLTDETDYVDSFSAAGGKVTYLLTRAELSYNDLQVINTSSDIKVLLSDEKKDVKVTDVIFDPSEIKPNKECNFSVAITNNGSNKVNEVILEFVPKDGSSAGVSKKKTVSIMPGETKNLNVSFLLPADYDSKIYVLKTPDNVLDSDDEAITVDMTKTDLRVDSEYIVDADSKFIKAIVGNVSTIDTNATTKIKNSAGEVVYEKQDTIYANNYKEYLFEIDPETVNAQEDIYTIETIADASEYYDSNNTCEQLVWNISKEKQSVSQNTSSDPSSDDDLNDDLNDDPGVKPGDIYNSEDNSFSDPSDQDSDQPILVSKITLTGISHQIAAGKRIALSAKISPDNATSGAVSWSSSNKKYAVVNQKGVVTTQKAGKGKTVTITAKANDGSGQTATYQIKIMKDAVKSVKISKLRTNKIAIGKKLNLKVVVKTTGKSANKKVSYSSSNTKYATVSSKGVVTAKKAGKGKTVTITVKATDGTGKKDKIKLKISK